MTFSRYKKSLLSRRMFYRLGTDFFVVVGALSILLEILTINFPESFQYGWEGVVSIVSLSLLFALIRSFPKFGFSVAFANPDTKITVKVGDLLKQDAHLVVGFCDTFDTEIGNIISASSMQGQFLTSLYENDRARLDKELATALEGLDSINDATKLRGKNTRYKIGTVAVLRGQGKKFFCCAYSRMGVDLKATSDINNIWLSLQGLWEKVRLEGEQKPIVLPVIGTYLSRVGGISYMLPIKLIMLSFIVNSRVEPISKELVIIVGDKDMEKVNFLEIEDFANSLNN